MAHNDSFDEPRFEALYRKLYPDLLRCAEIALRTGGSWYVSVAGRAEEVVQELQSIIDLPLQIDTSDIEAMERALRIYNGKPLINSVNGKQETMKAVFPLVKKYGGVVVALESRRRQKGESPLRRNYMPQRQNMASNQRISSLTPCA